MVLWDSSLVGAEQKKYAPHNFEENVNATVPGPLLFGDRCYLKTSAIVLVFITWRIWDKSILTHGVRGETATLTLQHSIRHLFIKQVAFVDIPFAATTRIVAKLAIDLYLMRR